MVIESEEITNLKPAVDFKSGYAYALVFQKSQKKTFREYIKIGSTRDFMNRLSSLIEDINFETNENFSQNIKCFVVSDWVADCKGLEKDIQDELSAYLVYNNTQSSKDNWPFKKSNQYKNEVFYAEVFKPQHLKLTHESLKEIFQNKEKNYKTQ